MAEATNTAPASNSTQTAPPPTDVAPAPAASKVADATNTILTAEPAKDSPKDAPAAELKFSEGFDPEAAKSFAALTKELGLDTEKAQKLLALNESFSAKAQKAQAEQIAKVRNEWVSSLKADPKIGGANFEKNINLAHRALAKFGGADGELKKFLDATGLGDAPPLVRMLIAVGQADADDSLAGATGTAGAGKRSERDALLAAYPSMSSQKE